MKKKFSFIFLFLWLIGVAVAYFILLPPINPSNIGFWMFFTPAVFLPMFLLAQGSSLKDTFSKENLQNHKISLGKAFVPTMIVVGMFLVYLLGDVIFSPVFSSKAYINRIEITTSSFDEDISEVDFDNLPLLDKSSAQKVGDRVVGQIPDLVSQFSVSEEYSLINYQGQIVRVSPLEHNGFFKYMSNGGGTAGYVIVDCTTGESNLVRTSEGLKYLPSAYFFNDLTRHVRFHYPFENLGEYSFELDENGTPYWVIQTLKYTWVSMKKSVSGVIVVNAIDGSMNYYKANEVPSWVDNVYDAYLVMEEIDSWGLYQNGYLNSKFAQKNVVQTTDGYTYLINGDDVYMYTGITSITSDESNIGFVMANLRTHEAKYYEVAGAEEYSAMDSATGMVQEKGYVSTFPLLINLKGRPTYLLSLKDDAGLVKMYAFVDVVNYQKVSVSDASYGIKYAANAYLKIFGIDDSSTQEKNQATMQIETITAIITEGNTCFYVLDSEGNKYAIDASIDLSITPFMKVGDNYTVTYYMKDSLRVVTEIKE